MGSGASRGSGGGHLTTETGIHGRRRYLYNYGGRRYDVTAFLERRRRRLEARERSDSRPATSRSASSSENKPGKLEVSIFKRVLCSISR